MTLYVDVIWFLNFCIDFILLWLTGWLLKRTFSWKRISLASGIASGYVFIILWPDLSFLYHPVLKLLFSVCILIMAFGFRRPSFIVKNVCMFYFVSFISGGGIFAAHYFMQSSSDIVQGVLVTSSGGMGDPISWLFVILGFPALIYFSRKRADDVKVQKVNYEQMTETFIWFNGTPIRTKALIDSGNKLRDPVSRLPVVILDMNVHGSHFPESIQNLAEDYTRFGDSEICAQWESKLRLVPFRSVGHQQFLLCVKPDRIEVNHSGSNWITGGALVGLSMTHLSADGQFDCIMHPHLTAEAEAVQAVPASSF
ncbi:sigma-E processing peptidase SpoIIGA [Fictibacillus aquaticus]|uniref:Sigma-E processing peptidase SpoIIGA n=1 Tax=Fictibacillus aquaticus TaxID=2021314 RepID=A0A235FDS8_9BACL|nr:sigma-E processing peptidase SpoIIGA [Fictibacillus aquaticus]OYD58935.1 sigma-E processing peptidase SpoIIGA [Fictibacillus aquaticus]